MIGQWRLSLEVEGGYTVRSIQTWDKSQCGKLVRGRWIVTTANGGSVEVDESRVALVAWDKEGPPMRAESTMQAEVRTS